MQRFLCNVVLACWLLNVFGQVVAALSTSLRDRAVNTTRFGVPSSSEKWRQQRSTNANPRYARWRESGNNIVRYSIAKVYSSDEVAAIQQAISNIENQLGGCIKFQPYNDEPFMPPLYGHKNKQRPSNILITPYSPDSMDHGICYSHPGRDVHSHSTQNVVISQKQPYGCSTNVRSIMRVLANLLGLRNQYQRPDRDLYIKVDMLAIDPQYLFSPYATSGPYDKCERNHDVALFYAYDYCSITQVPANYLAKPGQLVFTVLQQFGAIPDSNAAMLSAKDCRALVALYQCSSEMTVCSSLPTCNPPSYTAVIAAPPSYGSVNSYSVSNNQPTYYPSSTTTTSPYYSTATYGNSAYGNAPPASSPYDATTPAPVYGSAYGGASYTTVASGYGGADDNYGNNNAYATTSTNANAYGGASYTASPFAYGRSNSYGNNNNGYSTTVSYGAPGAAPIYGQISNGGNAYPATSYGHGNGYGNTHGDNYGSHKTHDEGYRGHDSYGRDRNSHDYNDHDGDNYGHNTYGDDHHDDHKATGHGEEKVYGREHGEHGPDYKFEVYDEKHHEKEHGHTKHSSGHGDHHVEHDKVGYGHDDHPSHSEHHDKYIDSLHNRPYGHDQHEDLHVYGNIAPHDHGKHVGVHHHEADYGHNNHEAHTDHHKSYGHNAHDNRHGDHGGKTYGKDHHDKHVHDAVEHLKPFAGGDHHEEKYSDYYKPEHQQPHGGHEKVYGHVDHHGGHGKNHHDEPYGKKYHRNKYYPYEGKHYGGYHKKHSDDHHGHHGGYNGIHEDYGENHAGYDDDVTDLKVHGKIFGHGQEGAGEKPELLDEFSSFPSTIKPLTSSKEPYLPDILNFFKTSTTTITPPNFGFSAKALLPSGSTDTCATIDPSYIVDAANRPNICCPTFGVDEAVQAAGGTIYLFSGKYYYSTDSQRPANVLHGPNLISETFAGVVSPVRRAFTNSDFLTHIIGNDGVDRIFSDTQVVSAVDGAVSTAAIDNSYKISADKRSIAFGTCVRNLSEVFGRASNAVFGGFSKVDVITPYISAQQKEQLTMVFGSDQFGNKIVGTYRACEVNTDNTCSLCFRPVDGPVANRNRFAFPAGGC